MKSTPYKFVNIFLPFPPYSSPALQYSHYFSPIFFCVENQQVLIMARINELCVEVRTTATKAWFLVVCFPCYNKANSGEKGLLNWFLCYVCGFVSIRWNINLISACGSDSEAFENHFPAILVRKEELVSDKSRIWKHISVVNVFNHVIILADHCMRVEWVAKAVSSLW